MMDTKGEEGMVLMIGGSAEMMMAKCWPKEKEKQTENPIQMIPMEGGV